MNNSGWMRSLVLSLFFFQPLLYAQDPPMLGLKVGLNFSKFNDDKAQSLAGFAGGGFLTYSLNDWLALQPEVIFTMKGGKLVEQATGYLPVEFDIRLNYVEIPVLAKVQFFSGGLFRPHLFAGPFVSYLTENIRQVDYGIAFGTGFHLNFESSALIFDLRYSLGMRDVVNLNTMLVDSTGAVIYQNQRLAKTGVFSVTIGLAFP